jgi:hypothetical protein
MLKQTKTSQTIITTKPSPELNPKPDPHPTSLSQQNTATPPTYPFPDYSVVKEQRPKNKTTGQSFPSSSGAD